MNITSAWVDDPSTRGELSVPQLFVEVTEMPDMTIPYHDFADGWRVAKFGPFVQYQKPLGATAIEFNARFRGRFPMVADVTIFVKDDTSDQGSTGFSLPLTRARQLMRKHDGQWHFTVNNKEAEAGNLLWLPEMVVPTCRVYSEAVKANCNRRPAKLVRVGGIELPLCESHVRDHNERQATFRVKTS